MWGNTLGWTISAALIVVMGAFVYIADRAGQISSPGDFALNAIKQGELTTPVSLQSILPKPSDRDDAAPLYLQAIKAYESDSAKYDHFNDRGRSDDIEKLDALEQLIRASETSRAKIFEDQPELIVNMHPEKPARDAVEALGSAAVRAALLMQSKDPATAKKYAQAGFALGARLFEERLTGAELMAGLQIMSESAIVLKKIATAQHDLSAEAKLVEFDAARQEFYKQRIEPMLRVLNAVDENIVGQHTGDVFYIAQDKKGERVWRVEAIFALGRMKYFVGTGGRIGDQRGAVKVLKRLAESDHDPVIRAAAASARDLTIDDYRRQH